MSLRQYVEAGDSTTQGTQGGFDIVQGGQGCWFELAAERLANIHGLGPLVSSGIRCVHLGFTASGFPSEWTVPGGGSLGNTVASTDPWDRYPYGADGRWANGSSFVWTWTVPAGYRPIVGFALYYIRKAGEGNWQYRIDGGTWTNMGQTLVGDNHMAKFYVNTPITATLDIRAFDGTAGCDTFPVGIELQYLAPGSDGVIFHNLAVNGSQLHQLCASTSGDRLAFFDSVQIDPSNGGGAIPPTPNAGVMVMHINDATIGNTSTWNADLTTFYNRCHPLGPVCFMSPYECRVGPATEASYRAQTKTSAAALGALGPLDIFDAWAANGWGGQGAQNAITSANGLLLSTDGTHEAQLGHLDIATRAYWFLRETLFAVPAVSTPFTVGGSGLGGHDALGGHASLAVAVPVSVTESEVVKVTTSTTTTANVTEHEAVAVAAHATYQVTVSATEHEAVTVNAAAPIKVTVNVTEHEAVAVALGTGHNVTVNVTESEVVNITAMSATTTVNVTESEVVTLSTVATVMLAVGATDHDAASVNAHATYHVTVSATEHEAVTVTAHSVVVNAITVNATETEQVTLGDSHEVNNPAFATGGARRGVNSRGGGR